MYKSTANIAIAKRMVCLIGIYLGRCPEKKTADLWGITQIALRELSSSIFQSCESVSP